MKTIQEQDEEEEDVLVNTNSNSDDEDDKDDDDDNLPLASLAKNAKKRQGAIEGSSDAGDKDNEDSDKGPTSQSLSACSPSDKAITQPATDGPSEDAGEQNLDEAVEEEAVGDVEAPAADEAVSVPTTNEEAIRTKNPALFCKRPHMVARTSAMLSLTNIFFLQSATALGSLFWTTVLLKNGTRLMRKT